MRHGESRCHLLHHDNPADLPLSAYAEHTPTLEGSNYVFAIGLDGLGCVVVSNPVQNGLKPLPCHWPGPFRKRFNQFNHTTEFAYRPGLVLLGSYQQSGCGESSFPHAAM